MSVIESIILGIIQGLAEFLPISSSGHLVIFQELFGLNNAGANHMMFDVFLHLGTLVSVAIAFRKTVLGLIVAFFTMLKAIFTGKYSYKNSNKYEKMIVLLIISIIPLFFILPFNDTLEKAFSSILVVGICLLITSALLFISDKVVKGKKTMNTAKPVDSLVVGIFQAAATLPGISRSGATITGGLLRGFDREFAVEFAFVMSIPAILGANVLSVFKIIKNGADTELYICLIGAAVAAVVGIFAIWMVKLIIKKDKFLIFSIYCAIVGLVAIVYSFVK